MICLKTPWYSVFSVVNSYSLDTSVRVGVIYYYDDIQLN